MNKSEETILEKAISNLKEATRPDGTTSVSKLFLNSWVLNYLVIFNESITKSNPHAKGRARECATLIQRRSKS